MGMNYGNANGGQQHDGYPKPTSSALAAKDSSKKCCGGVKEQSQAAALIDLVLGGEDAQDLMSNTIEQIHGDVTLGEGYGGGPYPIGSSVKVNTGGTFEKVGGGTISVKKGDVVSIVNPYLGEKGTDRMVLLSDGATKAVVPLAVLGESLGFIDLPGSELPESVQGPKGHVVPSASGKRLSRDGKVLGQSAPSTTAPSKGKSSAASADGTTLGQGAPTDDKSAQSKGSSSPTALNPSRALEHHDEVMEALAQLLESCSDADFRLITNIRSTIDEVKDFDLLSQVHNMLFSEDNDFSLNDMWDSCSQFVETADSTTPNPFAKKSDKKKTPPKKTPPKKDPPMEAADPAATDEEALEDCDKNKKKSKGAFPGAAPPFKAKKNEAAGTDPKIPQGKPGKNKTGPGLKESDHTAVKSAVSSIFSRIDEDTQNNLN